MKKIFFALAALLCTSSLFAQEEIKHIPPGLDIIGQGYNIFGYYARQESLGSYPIFEFKELDDTQRISSKLYKKPSCVFLKNISTTNIKKVEGESISSYAKSLSNTTQLGYDGLTFSASVEAQFGTANSEENRSYCLTILEIIPKWHIVLEHDEKSELTKYFHPSFAHAIKEMEPSALLEKYGTHVVVGAYIGGRAEYSTKVEDRKSASSYDLRLSIEAEYSDVSASNELSKTSKVDLSTYTKTTTFQVFGGNNEYRGDHANESQYEKWASGISTAPVLCDFDKNSLIGIWELAEGDRKGQIEAAFMNMLADHPLPEGNASLVMQNSCFKIKSSSEKTFLDIPGYNLAAETEGAKVGLHGEDNGADRFVKVIRCQAPGKEGYVFLQPQHSDCVLDIPNNTSNTNTQVQLYSWGSDNTAQMFKLIEAGTDHYYIETFNGLYLTAQNGKIVQMAKTETENQKWFFKSTDPYEEMDPPNLYGVTRFKNEGVGKYINLRGDGKNAQKKDGDLTVTKGDGSEHLDSPDFFWELEHAGVDGEFFIRANHTNCFWDAAGGHTSDGTAIQLWDLNKGGGQVYRFKYAGEPLTYYIINKQSNKAVDLDNNSTNRTHPKIQLFSHSKDNDNPNQKWKMDRITRFGDYPGLMNQVVYIKNRYSDKVWDLDRDKRDGETNYNGAKFHTFGLRKTGDQLFRVKTSNQQGWINLEVQNGNRYVDVDGNNSGNGTRIHLWDKNDGPAQRFQIRPTGETSCIIFTNHWKTIHVHEAKYWEDGKGILQWDKGFGPQEQWELIRKDGKRYNFYKQRFE